MLEKAKSLRGYKIRSLDGEIGSVKEFYFEDNDWTIRYLIANTGNWLSERQVLIAPCALISVNNDEKYISANMTKEQIEASPVLETDKPISRQFEERIYAHYEWPIYWADAEVMAYPIIEPDDVAWEKEEREKIEKTADSHLQSTRDLTDYEIQATDGEIGHIVDFVIDVEAWIIRYLILSTRNWWPGEKVLVSTKWIDHINWKEMKIVVNLQRERIKQSPKYTEDALITREYETDLHTHYGCKPYWNDPAEDKGKTVKASGK